MSRRHPPTRTGSAPLDPGGRFSALLVAAGASALVSAPHPAAAQAWRFHAEGVLGTSLDVAAVTPSRAEALVAAQAARAEIARLDRVLSGWRDDSELCALNRTRGLTVSPDLFAVLTACERWRDLTHGAFDHRLGPAFALRRDAAAIGLDPDPETLAILIGAGRAGQVRLDPATRRVSLGDGVTLAPEALAKGYVVDAALSAARAAAPGVLGLMVDIGGDLRTWGRGPDGDGWTVGVAGEGATELNAAPVVLIRAGGLAIATSGGRGAGGGHIIGGMQVSGATVAAASAADADALATALCAMPADAGMALAESLPGMEARVVAADGAERMTSGWNDLTTTAPSPPPARLWRVADAAPAQASVPWPRRFAVTVSLQLPEKGPRTYPPYVAIWVSDEEGRLVRALAMYGQKLDYVNENYVWWRRYGRARPEIVAAITRPTQPPGRYTLVWDGRDDMGHPVGQGHYTLHLEATREDGFHSYQSIELALGAIPSAAMADAQDELGVTAVRYGPR